MLAILCDRDWRREWTTCGGLSCGRSKCE